ncbi:MAG: MBL fold metallo-hydrolase [Lachnospiraceae bacterium]|nr:MBL fold metallo-hydrolase [Lachnospiraceae bacterium]MDO4409495.1 MBL fold metallo-hydrolase [Eubacteriales bacterium]
MELQFIGADHEVTGSCHYIQTGSKNILIDCGMRQGSITYENVTLPVSASKIDFVIVTHAHIDHTGMLPKLYKEGFRGQVVATEATADLCDIMLRDSAHIQTMEAEWKNKKGVRNGSEGSVEPIYTMEDAMNLIRLIAPYSYNKIYTLCDGVRFRFTDIGHLLGSASVEIWLTEGRTEKKIVFSGDIGNKDQPLLKDPIKTDEADYVVMESTYGDREHELERGDPIEELADILRDTFARGGNVVIPSFAVGRTQVMLYYLRHIKQNNLLPEYKNFPVYVDSPLAASATEIFVENEEICYDDEALALLHQGINPITFPGLQLTIAAEESKAILEDYNPKVIISASGMCDAGRIKHHLKHNLWRPECTILFVGYQSAGTPGRRILDGAEEIKIFGEEVAVRAKIESMKSLSGHADRTGLLDWIDGFKTKPRQVFVVHGDDKVTTEFAELLNDRGYTAMAPFSGTRYDLATGKFIEITKGVAVSREAKARIVSDSYTKLKLSTKKLEELVANSTGLPNKDLDKFTAELEKLIEKYRR